jgi:hypothetical protein
LDPYPLLRSGATLRKLSLVGRNVPDGRAQYQDVIDGGELSIGALCQSSAVRSDGTLVACAMYACTLFSLKVNCENDPQYVNAESWSKKSVSVVNFK